MIASSFKRRSTDLKEVIITARSDGKHRVTRDACTARMARSCADQDFNKGRSIRIQRWANLYACSWKGTPATWIRSWWLVAPGPPRSASHLKAKSLTCTATTHSPHNPGRHPVTPYLKPRPTRAIFIWVQLRVRSNEVKKQQRYS